MDSWESNGCPKGKGGDDEIIDAEIVCECGGEIVALVVFPDQDFDVCELCFDFVCDVCNDIADILAAHGVLGE